MKKKTDEVVSHFGKSRLLSLPFVFVARFVNNNIPGKLKVRKENTCPPAPHSSCTPSEGTFTAHALLQRGRSQPMHSFRGDVHSPSTPSEGDVHSPCTPSEGDVHSPCTHSEGDFHSPCTHSERDFHSQCTHSEGDFHNSMYRLSHYKSVLSGAIASHFVHKLAFFGD